MGKTENDQAGREAFYSNPKVVCFLALVACAFWGSAFPCVKLSYEWIVAKDAGSQILLSGYRNVIAGVLAYILAAIMQKKMPVVKKESFMPVTLLGLTETTLQYALYAISIAHMSSYKGSIINSANVFVAIIFARILFPNEKLTRKKITGCIIGFMGILVINLMPGSLDFSFTVLGEGFMLLTAVVYGITSVYLKVVSKNEDAVTVNALQLLIGGVALCIVAFVMNGNIGKLDTRSILLLIYLGAVSTIGYTIWTILMKYNPVGRIAVYAFAIPIFGTLLSGLILGEEIFTFRNLIALILVSAGIIVVNYVGGRSAAKA